MMSILQRWRGMSCEDVMEVLQSYLDGEIDVATARKVATHLDRCTNCLLESDVYQRIKVSLSENRDPIDPVVLESLRSYGERLARGDIA